MRASSIRFDGLSLLKGHSRESGGYVHTYSVFRWVDEGRSR